MSKTIEDIEKEIEKAEEKGEGYVPDLLTIELLKYIKHLREKIKTLEEV